MNTHNGDRHLQTKERGLGAGLLRGEIKPAIILILDLQAAALGENKCLLFKLPRLGILLHRPTKLIHSPRQNPCLGPMPIPPGKHDSMESST